MHWWDKQLAEYQPLPTWKDFPARVGAGDPRCRRGRAEDFPFWLLTARSMQYSWGGNVGIQMIKEVADNIAGPPRRHHQRGAAAAAGHRRRRHVEVAAPQRTTRGRAVVREGIRPDTLLMIGQFDHWATPFAKDFGDAEPERAGARCRSS